MPSISEKFPYDEFQIKGSHIKIGEKWYVARQNGERLTSRRELKALAKILHNTPPFGQFENQIHTRKPVKITIRDKSVRFDCGSRSKVYKAANACNLGRLQGKPVILREVATRPPRFDSLSTRIRVLAANLLRLFMWTLDPLAVRLESLHRNHSHVAYFNYSWKSSERAIPHPDEKAISKRYEGQSQVAPIYRGLEFAREFQKHGTHESTQATEIQTIVDHRRILAELTRKLHSRTTESSTKEIQRRISALDDPASMDVVHVHTKGYSCFTIPGGYFGHAVTYEFQRSVDGKYYFVIHNRGGGLDDAEIHGKILKYDGVDYARTSVKIAVTKEQIENPEFLKRLLVAKELSSDMAAVYEDIRRFLSCGFPPELQIEMSNLEKEFLKNMEKLSTCDENESKTYFKLCQDVHKNFTQLIHEDPAYHSIQVFGTCTESSLTGPEKAMASPKVRRKLKLFTVDCLAQQVVKKRGFWFIPSRRKKVLMHHYEITRNRIFRKIGE